MLFTVEYYKIFTFINQRQLHFYENNKDDENVLTNAYDITETFNNYFSYVGQKLVSKFISTDKNAFRNHLSQSVSSSSFLNPNSPFKVMKQMQLLKNSKSCGHNNILAYFLKIAADILIVP